MKKILALVIILAFVFTLGACNGNGDVPTEPPTDTPTDTPADTPVVEEEEVDFGARDVEPEPGAAGSIELWSMFTGQDGDTFANIIDGFNATNPDFTVIYRPMEAGDMYLNWALAAAAGEGIPDISMSHIERLPLFQREGRLTDLSPFLERAGISPDDFSESAWSMGSIGGGQYGIPIDMTAWILWVNMDLYEELGLNVLDMDNRALLWDDLFNVAPDIIEAGYIPYGIDAPFWTFIGTYGQLGGILSDDGTTPSFDNDLSRTVINHYRDLIERGFTQPEGVSAWDEFLAGNIVFHVNGVWALNPIRESAINIEMFNFPAFDVDNLGHWASSHFMTIPYNPDMGEDRIIASLQAMAYLVANSMEWSMAGLIPVHQSVIDDPAFRELPQAFLADQNEEHVFFDYIYYGYAMDALGRVMHDMFFGHLSVDDGLAQAQAETRDLIEMGGQ
jgi:multiple sugar transport system substrate-binding protein